VRETRETISQVIQAVHHVIPRWDIQRAETKRVSSESRNMIGDGMSVDCRRCLASKFHFLAGVELLALSVPDQSPLQNSSSSGGACLHNTHRFQDPTGPGPTSSSILIIVLNHRIPSIWSFYFNDDFFVSRIGSSIHN